LEENGCEILFGNKIPAQNSIFLAWSNGTIFLKGTVEHNVTVIL
jgi:hypothetical protein